METTRFDQITSTLAETSTRRGAQRFLVAAAFGAGSMVLLGADESEARRRRSGSRADRCSGPVGICNADPTPCGRTATGEICGCERSVEGNNVCVNSGDGNVCAQAVECTSTDGPEATSCRSQVGFHFYCQEAKSANGKFCGCGFGTTTGRVCVPECDNTNPY